MQRSSDIPCHSVVPPTVLLRGGDGIMTRMVAGFTNVEWGWTQEQWEWANERRASAASLRLSSCRADVNGWNGGRALGSWAT